MRDKFPASTQVFFLQYIFLRPSPYVKGRNLHVIGSLKVGGIPLEGDGHPGAGVDHLSRNVEVAVPGGAVGGKGVARLSWPDIMVFVPTPPSLLPPPSSNGGDECSGARHVICHHHNDYLLRTKQEVPREKIKWSSPHTHHTHTLHTLIHSCYILLGLKDKVGIVLVFFNILDRRIRLGDGLSPKLPSW